MPPLDGADIGDRMARNAGHDLDHDHDQAQVHGELTAHLEEHGHQIAQDQGLGHTTPDDLVRLGELDIIGTHPTLDPGLATHLDMIMAKRDHNPFEGKFDCVGCSVGTHRHAPCTTDQDQEQDQTAPEESVRSAPEGIGFGFSDALEEGQVVSQRRDQAKSRVRKRKIDRNPLRDLELAAAYAVEQGIVSPPSTVTRLIDQSRKARRFQPMDDGDAA
jgi:hypothetical protein